ncbi:MAG: dephospho-CoA kinase [Epsilonproteobacteria bacterium]|nr:dephospho-CoA kinase [Campylobacterota bacterium]OIO16880.1 MAG: dephospho-CoA kinase [Helicobacteraceae bacterium CG1_02_36_14]PIP09204.1 MAG: dephospho-CoA kinase [Sulfurimonas sp. CG23_combo_of_CG06-09_8_20_14_all_36_33]PIS24617.1 MAG: dephospho-CoA kinase [Sulfurimonas sp. CG08_land_8_20_14_0_20_36_33]PIU34966.1 MAG: dephospho-CoA kinase [Sulfurimonas sp. CG07_land_8_20_14_0_80_36_56]PIV02946.1 MAG: dephospho-CoA kinase [Sulfurimonas sp. CG03_land_8_20_14_0_80_36_25]PIV36710.1 MAG: dep
MAFEYAIALTGGIATGKSTVASLLSLNGMRVIDADTISHEILDASSGWVQETFGDEYVENNKVNRAKLGVLVFSDDKVKKVLEDFLHPKIREEIEKRSVKQDSFKFPYLIDIPLFFEKNAYDIKESVVVYTPSEIQLERFIKRNGYSKEDSIKRIHSQMPVEEKKKRATWVIDNSKDLKHLQRECEEFVEKIKRKYLQEKK